MTPDCVSPKYVLKERRANKSHTAQMNNPVLERSREDVLERSCEEDDIIIIICDVIQSQHKHMLYISKDSSRLQRNYFYSFIISIHLGLNWTLKDVTVRNLFSVNLLKIPH